jgi:ribosomal protein S18 acetylase RimI-like enzyme
LQALEALVIPNRVHFLKAFAVGSGGKVENFAGVTCIRNPIPEVESNSAYIMDRAGAEDGVLAKIKEFFQGLQSDWMLVLPPSLVDVSWEIPKRVAVARWVRLAELVLPRESASLRDSPSELEIRQVSNLDELLSWARTNSVGFGDSPSFLDPFVRRESLEMRGISYYVGSFSGKHVATSLSCVANGVAGVYAVATIPEFRGRGFGTAMTAFAVKEGFAKGCDLATLQSGSMSTTVYLRMGFRYVFDSHCWVVSYTRASSPSKS